MVRMRRLARLSLLLVVAACGIDAVGVAPREDGDPVTPEQPSGVDASEPSSQDASVDAEPDAAPLDDAAVDAPIDAPVDAPIDTGPTTVFTLTHAAAPATVDLTAEGTVDWAYWGANGSSSSTRKAGTSQISLLTVVYLTTGAMGSGFGTTFSWTDATDGAGSSDGYLYVTGTEGAKESFTVPSGPTKRTLVVFVGGSSIRGRLTAKLGGLTQSDASYDENNGSFAAKYTVEYATPAASQLQIEWSIDKAYGGASARFTAVALR